MIGECRSRLGSPSWRRRRGTRGSVGLVATDPVEVRHDRGARRSTAGFWAVVAEFEGAVTAVRFARVEPVCRRRRRPAPWSPLEGEWHTSLDHAAYLERGGGDPRADRGGHRLPGQPLPGAVARARRRAPTSTAWPTCSTRGNPAPHAGRIHVPAAGLDVVCASPEAFLLRDGDRLESRPIKGTATTPRGDAAQGLRRERHDRRPRPQRPVARLPRGHRAGRPPVRAGGAPRAGPPRVRGVGGAAPGRAGGPRSWRRRSRRVRCPGRRSHSCAAGDPRPRDRAPRSVLRRHRLDRRRPRRGGTRGGHPDVLGRAGRRRSAVAAVRHRGGHHVGVRPRGGMGGDSGEIRTPGRVWHLEGWRHEQQRAQGLGQRPADRGGRAVHRGARPRGDRRRRGVRDGQGRPGARCSPRPATPAGSTAPSPGSGCRRPTTTTSPRAQGRPGGGRPHRVRPAALLGDRRSGAAGLRP